MQHKHTQKAISMFYNLNSLECDSSAKCLHWKHYTYWFTQNVVKRCTTALYNPALPHYPFPQQATEQHYGTIGCYLNATYAPVAISWTLDKVASTVLHWYSGKPGNSRDSPATWPGSRLWDRKEIHITSITLLWFLPCLYVRISLQAKELFHEFHILLPLTRKEKPSNCWDRPDLRKSWNLLLQM